MVMTDPIADMLTRIRNGLQARHESVDVPASNLKAEILRVMKAEGYIKNYKVIGEGEKKTIKVFLKYTKEGKPALKGLKRISKPGRRVYGGYDEIPYVMNGLGISVVSTSKGILTDKEARSNRVGGEILCSIW
jgi:small subunit ribosomal protein S8